MLRKIYTELVLIRKELHFIRNEVESKDNEDLETFMEFLNQMIENTKK